MLVLARKEGEKIYVGEHGEIVITVVHIKGGCVRLGIEAPRHIPIERDDMVKGEEEDDDGTCV